MKRTARMSQRATAPGWCQVAIASGNCPYKRGHSKMPLFMLLLLLLLLLQVAAVGASHALQCAPIRLDQRLQPVVPRLLPAGGGHPAVYVVASSHQNWRHQPGIQNCSSSSSGSSSNGSNMGCGLQSMTITPSRHSRPFKNSAPAGEGTSCQWLRVARPLKLRVTSPYPAS